MAAHDVSWLREMVWRGHDLAAALVLGATLVVIAATFRDYGLTWDEEWHHNYGIHILRWYGSFFHDDSALHYRADYLYGGAFDALGAMARGVLPFDRYESVHLFGALIGFVGLVGAWRLGRELGGAVSGFWSLVLLVTTPVYYGHMFNNPKDLPFAVGYVWALHYIIVVLRRLPSVSRGTWIKLGFALGAAMSVRIAGLLTICFLGLGVCCWLAYRFARTRSLDDLVLTVHQLAPRLLGSVALAWVVMLTFWPWAQLQPLRRPVIALTRMSAFLQHVRHMPFRGESVLTTEVPWDYMPRYFAIKLPELVLVLAVVGVLALVSGPLVDRLRRLEGDGPTFPRAALALLVFAIVFPWAYAVYKHSPLYDGLRHFLFLVPLVGVLAGVTLGAAIQWALGRVLDDRRQVMVGVAGVLSVIGLVSVADQARTMIRLHPHQYVAFNRLVGGLPGAYRNYDTDYYGETYKETLEVLADHLWETERDAYLEGHYVVGVCGNTFQLVRYFPPAFVERNKRSKDRKHYDFYSGYTRSDCDQRLERHPIILEVQRDETRLNVVRDIRKKSARRAGTGAGR